MTKAPVQKRFEISPGADRTASPSSWVWQDDTDLLTDDDVRLRDVGRADEASETSAATADLELKNGKANKVGRWTPRNPASPLYPFADAGMPARIVAIGGSPHLTVTGVIGSKATTPDDPSLDITSDLSGVIEAVPFWIPDPSVQVFRLAGKYVIAANQRSWVFELLISQHPRLAWSPDGVNVLVATGTAPIPRLDTFSAWGWWIDVSDGGNRVIRFYWAETAAELLADPAAHLLGDPVVQSGTTSIFSSTSPLDIGVVGDNNLTGLPGMVRSFQLRSGDLSTGTVVADPQFSAQPEGATALTDSAGRAWTFPSLDRRHIRLSGETGAVRATWPGDGVTAAARARVPVSGPLRRMGQGAKPLQSALRRRILAPVDQTAVEAYWPWEDERQATVAASPIPGVAPMTVVGFQFASGSDLDASLPLATLASGDGGGWSGSVPEYTYSSFWSVDWFVDVPEPPGSGTSLQGISTTGTAQLWSITFNSSTVTITATNAVGVNVFTPATFPWDARFQVPSLLRLQVEQDGGNVDWAMNWVPIYGGGAGLAFGTSGSFAGTAGRATRLANIIPGPPQGITVGHMVVAADQGLGWLAPADSAYVGEVAGTRFKRLCDEEGIAVTIVGDPEDSEPMGPQRPLTLLQLLRECRDVDMGILGEQRYRDGLLYRVRRSLYNQASRFTIPKLRNPFEVTADDAFLRNDVQVVRPGGSSHRVVDEDTSDRGSKYRGVYDESTDVNVRYDTQLPDQAGWRLHLGTTPDPRYPSLSFRASGVGDAFMDAWLALGLGDRFTAPNSPEGHPSAAIDQIVQGWAETLGRFAWDVDVPCSPATPWEVGVRNDTERGRRGSAGSELAASFAAGTATSMSVAITLGSLWTTAAGDMPIDIEASGVRLRVTAISGGSSPQTFTVQQTPINGISKTIPAGTRVRLWRPTIRAL